MSYTIYALKDPRTDAVRYIGVTKLPLFLRLRNHLREIPCEGKKSPKVQWLRMLERIGLRPTIWQLAFIDADDPGEAGAEEQLWIRHFKEQGCDLLNVRKGGEGLHPRSGLSQWALDRLGTMLDTEIAKHEGKHPVTIRYWRHKLGIPQYSGYWAKSWSSCQECGTTQIPHHSRGLCKYCYNHRWREMHSEHLKECKAQWNEANKERIQERNHRWYRTNKQQYLEHRRQQRKAHPAASRAAGRRYRARRHGAVIDPVDEAVIYERGRACIYCGSTDNLTLDFIVPLSRGGPHCEDNLAVACRSCNRSKGAKLLTEWIQTQPRALAWVS